MLETKSQPPWLFVGSHGLARTKTYTNKYVNNLIEAVLRVTDHYECMNVTKYTALSVMEKI